MTIHTEDGGSTHRKIGGGRAQNCTISGMTRRILQEGKEPRYVRLEYRERIVL
ncbi:MAG TPA: hypothetical protein PLP42_06385 [Acidobacteriota bacterium]|nr:hypothetical protein [Acidobacteriota bacterium]